MKYHPTVLVVAVHMNCVNRENQTTFTVLRLPFFSFPICSIFNKYSFKACFYTRVFLLYNFLKYSWFVLFMRFQLAQALIPGHKRLGTDDASHCCIDACYKCYFNSIDTRNVLRNFASQKISHLIVYLYIHLHFNHIMIVLSLSVWIEC